MPTIQKALLIILDGWGIGEKTDSNACFMAKTPYLDSLLSNYPTTSLLCSGKSVGLSDGIMGNSEVGHMNIGAGRVVYQNLKRIDQAVEDGSITDNLALQNVMSRVKVNKSTLHLTGLLSDGGVHSQLSHLFALIEMAEKKDVEHVMIHVILDGRDTSPDSGIKYVRKLQEFISTKKNVSIASLCGRFYAMDRDTRWNRVEKAYRLFTEGLGTLSSDPCEAITSSYNRKVFDEFLEPVALSGKNGKPAGVMESGDGMIFFNFRADRAREITRTLTDPDFKDFKRLSLPEFCDYVCMTSYDETFSLPVAFAPIKLNKTLGEIISCHQLKQLRIAETEKYAHVTYFFNGGEEKPFENEDRVLVPSPRDVATYDMKPAMSATEVADKLSSTLERNDHDLYVVNFANMDMVGHTGNIKAAIKGCETVDSCVKQVITTAQKSGIPVLLTADHGNSEKMRDTTGAPHTAHTMNPVPLVLVDGRRKNAKLAHGKLADIAPTILEIMGLPKPDEMDGKSLIV